MQGSFNYGQDPELFFFVKWQVYFQLSAGVFFEGYECFATNYNIFNWHNCCQEYFSIDKGSIFQLTREIKLALMAEVHKIDKKI